MFVDEAVISVISGKGGDGCVHFRREKYVPKGGPDGGNGGKGGNIVFCSSENRHTLSDFRHQKIFRAENGRPGDQNLRTGANGADLPIAVPVGTVIRNRQNNDILADFTAPNQSKILAQGGVGGKGNAGFKSSVRQAPNFAEKGDRAETLELELELKLVADAAIVGLPSAGKSTLISVVSAAKPKIADYPFTTLVPNLGVCRRENREIVLVDVPGLIAGASEGKGLGHQFLRHIERSKFLVHLIDASAENPISDFETVSAELQKFSKNLAAKPVLPVFSKLDVAEKSQVSDLKSIFLEKFGETPLAISAATGENMGEFLHQIFERVPEKEPENLEPKSEKWVEFFPGKVAESSAISIEKKGQIWHLQNARIQRLVRQTPTENEMAVQRIYDVLERKNVFKKMEILGAIPGEFFEIEGQKFVFRGT